MPQQAPAHIDNQSITPAVWVYRLKSKSALDPNKAWECGTINITTYQTISELSDAFLIDVFKDGNASEGRITCTSNPSLVLYFHEDHPKMMMVLPKGTRKHKSTKGFA